MKIKTLTIEPFPGLLAITDLPKEDKEKIVAGHLATPEGRQTFKEVFQRSAATAADKFPEGSFKESLARRLAGLPNRPKP